MTSPPSLLLVLPWDLSAVGGVNQVVRHLVQQAAAHGPLRPIVFCADWERPDFACSQRDGVMLVRGRLRAPLGGSRPLRDLAGFLHRLRADLQAWEAFLGQHNVQVIHAHYAGPQYTLFALLRALRRSPARLLFSVHGADVTNMAQSGPLGRSLARWMLGRADRVVCCSDSLAERAEDALGLGRRRLLTIHNGIDPDELERSRTVMFRPDVGDCPDYLVNVATFEPKKGQDVLLRAYTELVHEGLPSALVMIGRRTRHLQELRRQAQRLGLQGRVFFLTDVAHPQTLAAIRQARALVLPSRDEPFGIVLLEAAYLGTPIVATRSGGIPEVLGSYYPYLASPDDPRSLARAIDDALFNPSETARQVELMQRRAADRFTWDGVYAAYRRLWSTAHG